MINPFEQPTNALDTYFMDWKKMNSKPYDKNKTDAYTKVRVILMNGTEFESNWFLHQFSRHCADNGLRRRIALVRAQEQQQQKRIASLKPLDENVLETTISYEQLAIDLTAILSQMETDANNIRSLNFALLEDFDHLYRFSNLLKMDYGVEADNLVGKYTEIMPARPTISEHRYAADNIKCSMNSQNAPLFSVLVGNIITAAEQQTMNFYMNSAAFYPNEHGRKLYSEIALIEEEHVSQYESLKDPTLTWLECWVMHEYTEAYLYYSVMNDEPDKYIQKVYAEHFEMEVAHLKEATECLRKYEKTNVKKLLPNPVFPQLIKFGENKEFIRKVIATTATLTNDREKYTDVSKLKDSSDFARFQKTINADVKNVPSHVVIERMIAEHDNDYRYQDLPHPLPEMDSRKRDNTSLGRI